MDSNVDKPTSIHKVINIDIKTELCDTCIKSKYTKIIKSKKMTLTTRKLQEIYVDLWRPHDPLSFLGRNYVTLLLNNYTWKSWILLLRSKNEFFDVFKLWLF